MVTGNEPKLTERGTAIHESLIRRLDSLTRDHCRMQERIASLEKRAGIEADPPPWGEKIYTIAFDGFKGVICGTYMVDGEPGVVLRSIHNKVVHVYKQKHIEGQ